MMSEISIVIPTYNGASRILTTLSSLEKQTYKDFEVVVIVDGSTDDTLSVIAGANLDLKLTVHDQPNRGRAGARNAGIRNASGKYLIFFDDDVVVSESVVENYVEMINRGYSIIAGALYPIYKDETEFTRYSTYLNNKWNGMLSDESETNKSPYLSACNFMITRSLAEHIGGFNGVLTDAEDMDMAIRLWEIGETIHFATDVQVGHTIQHGIADYASRQVEYRHARKMLLQVNPAASKYLGSDYKFRGIKSAIFKLLSARLFLKLVDAGTFRFLPQSMRFRLYDILLTAYAHYGRERKSPN